MKWALDVAGSKNAGTSGMVAMPLKPELSSHSLSFYLWAHQVIVISLPSCPILHVVNSSFFFFFSVPLFLLCILGIFTSIILSHSCQPLLGVNLSPEFVNLYFLYAGWGLLFFCWYQRHFEFQLACVAVEGRTNVWNTHVRLQISLPRRFLSLSH